MELTYDNYLAHYGVKGMRWGVRRSKNSSGSSSGKQSNQQRSERRRKAVAAGLAAAGVVGIGTVAYAAKRRAGKKAAAKLMADKVAKMSMTEFYLHLNKTQPTPSKQFKKDAKLYGTKGAKRVRNKIRRGSKPEDARAMETGRSVATFLAKAAWNSKRAKE